MAQNNKNISMKDLIEWSGESTVRKFRYIIPILKFNGNTGKFSLLIPDEAGNWVPEEINKSEIEIVILKVRRVLTSYEKLSDGSRLRTFTNEHNSWKDKLSVFQMKKGDKKPKMIEEGSIEEIREHFPKLRLKHNLYCLYNDKIVKLNVRGKSLSSLFNYYKEFGPQEHFFEFITKLSCHSETNEGGLTYYVIDWTKLGKSDFPFVAEKLKEVRDSLELQDKQYSNFEEAKEHDLVEKLEEENSEPVIEENQDQDFENKSKPQDIEKDDEGEVEVEDIPF